MSSLCGIVAGIDVHKRTVTVVLLDSTQPEHDHATGRFGTTHFALQQLVAFLHQYAVTQVAMESTAQYWRPVWMTLEGEFDLTLAQARSTHAPRGRKRDLVDARRIARRLLSGDLTVSYVPSPEQREWRLLSRTRIAMLESVVRVRNQIEVLLEQAQIKLSSVIAICSASAAGASCTPSRPAQEAPLNWRPWVIAASMPPKRNWPTLSMADSRRRNDWCSSYIWNRSSKPRST